MATKKRTPKQDARLAGSPMSDQTTTTAASESMTREDVIARIRTGLRRRSHIAWSVTGGRGTAYGWLTIDAPPRDRTWRYRLKPGMLDAPESYEEYDAGTPGGHASPSDRRTLAALLNLDAIHHQGVSIPASHDHYREYIDRAEGRAPRAIARPYWD